MIKKLESIKKFKEILKSIFDTNLKVCVDNKITLTKAHCFRYLCNYIDIMELTLELGQFVACVDGVPLEGKELLLVKGIRPEYNKHNKRLITAQSKVLFKGFEVLKVSGDYIAIEVNEITIWIDLTEINKISDLITICKGADIEVTEAFNNLITE